MCDAYKCKEKYPLTWNGGSLYKEANFHYCWPHAQSQLPHFIPLVGPPFPPSLPHVAVMTTDDINMPESSSVGHMKACQNFFCLKKSSLKHSKVSAKLMAVNVI
jgi:hypothetical protein